MAENLSPRNPAAGPRKVRAARPVPVPAAQPAPAAAEVEKDAVEKNGKLGKALVSLRAEHEELTLSYGRALTESRSLRAELEGVRSQFSGKTKMIAKLEAELEQSRKDRDEAGTRALSLSGQVSSLESDKRALRTTLDAAEKARDTHYKTASRTAGELSGVKALAEETRRALTVLAGKAAELADLADAELDLHRQGKPRRGRLLKAWEARESFLLGRLEAYRHLAKLADESRG